MLATDGQGGWVGKNRLHTNVLAANALKKVCAVSVGSVDPREFHQPDGRRDGDGQDWLERP